jgi:hypothetical protein
MKKVPKNIQSKIDRITEVYVAMRVGEDLEVKSFGKWIDMELDRIQEGPTFKTIDMWRVKKKPKRKWSREDKTETNVEETAKIWKALGFKVTEWQEVIK